MKNKYFLRILIMIIVLTFLAGCGKAGNGEKPADIKMNSDTRPKDEGPVSKPTIKEDGERLVEIVIENGEATISFDFDRWEELYQLKKEAPAYVEIDAMSKGPFPIIVESGKVIDAFVAFVDGAILHLPGQANTLPAPIVVLLMDDSSLEWFEADPYYTMYIKGIGGDYGDYIGFESLGKLPHRDDFLSFSYEDDGEGYGNKTIFVTSATGEKYDICYLIYESRFFYGTWVCQVPPDYSMYGFLTFTEDGGVEWEMGEGIDVGSGYKLGQAYETWTGTYEYIKTNDREYPIGTLVFDMYGWWIYEGEGDIGYEDQMKGAYRVNFEHMDGLNLVYNDGVALYQLKKDYKEYNFRCYDMYIDQ